MFTEEDAPIVKWCPSNFTLKMHDTKNSCKLFLTVFQKTKKIRKCTEVKGKDCRTENSTSWG